MSRRSAVALSLAVVLGTLAATPSLAGVTVSVDSYTSPTFGDGSFFILRGTSIDGPKVIDLTPGVAQDIRLDDQTTEIGGSRNTYTGAASLAITLDGVSHTLSQSFSFFSGALDDPNNFSIPALDLSAGSPQVFDLGGGVTVSVTPIATSDNLRAATFLETTTTTTVPEPSTLTQAGGLAALASVGFAWRKRRRSRGAL